MGRRILNRKDLRADYDAAEARRKQDDDDTDTDTDDEEEDDDDESAEAGDDAEEGEEGEEGDEEAPVKKKKKVVKEVKPKRTRTPKVVRMKVVWGVFNNSNQRVAVYDYPKKKEAEEHAAKLKADKNQTFFVQPVKEAIE
jgi:recombination DNA repair RAD52 pathway protein